MMKDFNGKGSQHNSKQGISFLQLCGKQIDSYQLILIVFSSSLLCDVKFQTISCNSVD